MFFDLYSRLFMILFVQGNFLSPALPLSNMNSVFFMTKFKEILESD